MTAPNKGFHLTLLAWPAIGGHTRFVVGLVLKVVLWRGACEA